MKTLILILITFISAFLFTFSLLWATISFIVYLVKDVPFQWNSLISFFINGFIMLLGLYLMVLHQFSLNKKEEEEESRLKSLSKHQSPFMSRFNNAFEKSKK
jgi:large-conductance mechanosensitive channel